MLIFHFANRNEADVLPLLIQHFRMKCMGTEDWFYDTEAQVKRRSFHAPNQIQLSVAVERQWSDVESNVAPNMPLLKPSAHSRFLSLRQAIFVFSLKKGVCGNLRLTIFIARD